MPETKTKQLPTSDAVRNQIAERAYFIAERDGFVLGKELTYWLAAEKDVLDAVLPAAKKTATKPAAKKAAAAKPAAKAPGKKAAKKA